MQTFRTRPDGKFEEQKTSGVRARPPAPAHRHACLPLNERVPARVRGWHAGTAAGASIHDFSEDKLFSFAERFGPRRTAWPRVAGKEKGKGVAGVGRGPASAQRSTSPVMDLRKYFGRDRAVLACGRHHPPT